MYSLLEMVLITTVIEYTHLFNTSPSHAELGGSLLLVVVGGLRDWSWQEAYFNTKMYTVDMTSACTLLRLLYSVQYSHERPL